MYGLKKIVSRILTVLLTFAVVIFVNKVNISNPMVVLMIPIVFFTYSDGSVGGFLSAAIAVGYSFWFFSEPGAFLSYSSTNLQKIVAILVSVVTIIILIGSLKRREQRYIKELDALNQRLQECAFVDPLTNAFNRRAFLTHFGEARLANAWGLTFALIDLDFFKKINDDHGHDIGDKVLKHVVEMIWSVIPASSNLYRWGGEEFLLVLKTNDGKRAQGIIESVRKKIESTGLNTDDGTLFVTVSIGCVSALHQDSIQECISRADHYLYEAKATGRNRVACAGSARDQLSTHA